MLKRIFSEHVAREQASEHTLGNRLGDEAANERRLNFFASLNPAGFRQPKKSVATDAQGRTRGDKKRARRAAAMNKVSEERPEKYRHSVDRRRRASRYK